MNKWQQLELWFDKGGNMMKETGDIDQFQLLEEKIDSLIRLVTELRNEKTLLAENVQAQDQKLIDLTEQIEGLKTTRENAKQRIIAMLEKLNQIEV